MDKTISIADEIIKAAQELTGVDDEKEAIERAVMEYVAAKHPRTPLESMLELAGKIDIRDDYDYKSLRAGGS